MIRSLITSVQVDVAFSKYLTICQGPLGSSSGSAVGVAAGYSPLSIGTETMGSIVSPATRASLYAVKPTQNAAQLYGVVPISAALDCVGPMAKDARDIADLLNVMLPDFTHRRSSSYVADLAAEWSDLRVGVLDLTQWSWPDHLPQLEHSAKEQMVPHNLPTHTLPC